MRLTSKLGLKFLLGGLAALAPLACLSADDTADMMSDSLGEELITARFQAEAQSWSTSSGDKVDVGSAVRLYANAANDQFSFSQSVAAGKYKVIVRYAQRRIWAGLQTA